MIKLSERLLKISNFIEKGETMADIGTDHGLLPISLLETGICENVILSDIGAGPLEKAKENLEKYCNRQGANPNFHLRQGSGLETLEACEVDVVVIAGMGGKLMIEILETDLEKTRSFSKIIFQPRNASDKLEQWLLEHDFQITDGILAREGKYIWEIFVAKPYIKERDAKPNRTMHLAVLPLLLKNKDPLLEEFLWKKIRVEEKIIEEIQRKATREASEKLGLANHRLAQLKRFIEMRE